MVRSSPRGCGNRPDRGRANAQGVAEAAGALAVEVERPDRASRLLPRSRRQSRLSPRPQRRPLAGARSTFTPPAGRRSPAARLLAAVPVTWPPCLSPRRRPMTRPMCSRRIRPASVAGGGGTRSRPTVPMPHPGQRVAIRSRSVSPRPAAPARRQQPRAATRRLTSARGSSTRPSSPNLPRPGLAGRCVTNPVRPALHLDRQSLLRGVSSGRCHTGQSRSPRFDCPPAGPRLCTRWRIRKPPGGAPTALPVVQSRSRDRGCRRRPLLRMRAAARRPSIPTIAPSP
jgi:hypothetical protein